MLAQRAATGGGAATTTWDAAKKGSAVTLSNGNLTASANSGHAVLSTAGKTGGKWYFEILVGSQADAYGIVGLATASQSLTTGIDFNVLCYRGDGSFAGFASASGWGPGHVIGIAFDMDGSTFRVYRNNTLQRSGTRSFTAETFIGAGDWGGAPGAHVFTIRPDAASQTYSPPSGYLPFD